MNFSDISIMEQNKNCIYFFLISMKDVTNPFLTKEICANWGIWLVSPNVCALYRVESGPPLTSYELIIRRNYKWAQNKKKKKDKESRKWSAPEELWRGKDLHTVFLLHLAMFQTQKHCKIMYGWINQWIKIILKPLSQASAKASEGLSDLSVVLSSKRWD